MDVKLACQTSYLNPNQIVLIEKRFDYNRIGVKSCDDEANETRFIGFACGKRSRVFSLFPASDALEIKQKAIFIPLIASNVIARYIKHQRP